MKENIDKQKNLSLEQKAFLEKRAQLRRQKASENLEETYVPMDLFAAPPLGIFTDITPDSEGTLLFIFSFAIIIF